MSEKQVKYPYRGGFDWSGPCIADIPDNSNPDLLYLRRIILFKTPLCALYLHAIYRPDGDRDPHNHPFPFISWVLWGGYGERRYVDTQYPNSRVEVRARKRWSIAVTRLTDFHQIFTLHAFPTITLVFCGRRQQEWGFWKWTGGWTAARKFVPWREYLEEANG